MKIEATKTIILYGFDSETNKRAEKKIWVEQTEKKWEKQVNIINYEY